MVRLGLLALLVLASLSQAAPQDSVVRIMSHGCSGTVIWTGQGKSYVLTCGHAFETRKDRATRITLDVPCGRSGATRTSGIRLVKLDLEKDLALIEVGYGPLPYVTPCAEAYHRFNRTWSIGYDEMRPKVTIRVATVLRYEGCNTITREAPWHGRSGGALLDPDKNVLVGTVVGYRGEPRRPGPGVYVSHRCIMQFLGYERAVLSSPGDRFKITEHRDGPGALPCDH
jgi:hypothetical protein